MTGMKRFYRAALSCQLALACLGWSWLMMGCSRDPAPPGGTEAGPKGAPSKPVPKPRPEWPMFRGGPALLGVTPDSLPLPLELLWSFKTGGPVKSSAAIVKGRVYVGSDDQRLHALDLATGTNLWSFKTEDAIESSPLVLEGRVYVGSDDNSVRCFEAATGKLLWQFKTEGKIPGGPNWVRSPQGDAFWILVGSYDYKLYCLDAATGRSNWVFECSNYINGTPAVAAGVTAFGGCDALLHVISLAEGKQLKEIEGGAYIAGSAALSGTRAYYGHMENEFRCADLTKGTNLWIYKDRAFPFYSSPAVTSERVVFGGRDKRVHCVKAGTGEPIWQFSTRGKVDSSPVICGDQVVVGSEDGRLYLLALSDGRQLWTYEIGEGISASPAVAAGKLVIGAEDGSVYCFGKK